MRVLIALVLTFTFVTATKAQNIAFASIDKSPLDVVMYRNDDNQAVARVIYSRPGKKNRKIFGELVPFDSVWRTGANEATEITFYQPVLINEQQVEPGAYSIFTIPGKDSWQLILNSEVNQWGTDYDETKNILITKCIPYTSPKSIEDFSITFVDQMDHPSLLLGWDETFIAMPFTLIEE